MAKGQNVAGATPPLGETFRQKARRLGEAD